MANQVLHTALDELKEDPDRLVEIILEQAGTIRELREEIRELKAANKELREKADRAEREGKRQAAPFRRPEKERKEKPKPPGRKPGHEGSYRMAPRRVDREIEVPLDCCPECGGEALDRVRPIEQYVEEIPPGTVEVIRLTTYRGRCAGCGTVETTHPMKTSGAVGSAGRMLGPRAKAVAMSLVHEHGMTLRGASGVLAGLFGLRISAGGLSQMAHRLAGRLEGEEARLCKEATEAKVQYVDETSWWVATEEENPFWLWVFANEDQTLYRVDHRRSRQVLEETLGTDFAGVLVSDCLPAYEEAAALQQKCYAHHLKAISRAESEHEALCGESSSYLGRVRGLLKGAMALGATQEELSPGRYLEHRRALEERADGLFERPRDDLTDSEESIRKRLEKQRDHLFVFLDHEGVAATNNLAERRLRPAVIRRKLSSGNRTRRGARTWEILASLMATYVQQGKSFVDLLQQTATYQPAPVR